MLARTTVAKIDLSEKILFAMIQEIGPSAFAIALNNACVHGNCFIKDFDEYLDEDDKFLGQWYEGIEKLKDAVKNLEESL